MPASDQHAFGRMLRRYRLAAELTQEALAERAGLSVRGISDLERGVNRAPYVATVIRLAEALEITEAQRDQLEATISRHRGPVRDRPARRLPEPLTPLIGRFGRPLPGATICSTSRPRHSFDDSPSSMQQSISRPPPRSHHTRMRGRRHMPG